MLEQFLAHGNKTFREAFETIIQEKATQIVDLGKIENAYQLFRKRFPSAPEGCFRQYIKATRPGDYEKCVRCFKWK